MSFFCMFRCKLMQHSLNNNPSGCVCHTFFSSAVKNQNAPVDIFLENVTLSTPCRHHCSLRFPARFDLWDTDFTRTGAWLHWRLKDWPFLVVPLPKSRIQWSISQLRFWVSGFLGFNNLHFFFLGWWTTTPEVRTLHRASPWSCFFAGCPSVFLFWWADPRLRRSPWPCYALRGWQIFPMLFTTAGNDRLGCPCTWLDPGWSWLLPWCRKVTEVDVGTGCWNEWHFHLWNLKWWLLSDDC